MGEELILDYTSPNFGKKNIYGKWPIMSDIKKYVFYVDKVPVININVEYERFDESIPNYSCAHVLYDNIFFYDKDSPYNNKGYATTALIEITKMLLAEGNVPRIVLNIVPSNVKSKRVSEKAGFSYIVNDEYSVFHPDALIMYQEGLQPLKKEDEELYEMQIEKYEKYIAKAQESMNNKSNANKTN